jgi:hypothetical protein
LRRRFGGRPQRTAAEPCLRVRIVVVLRWCCPASAGSCWRVAELGAGREDISRATAEAEGMRIGGPASARDEGSQVGTMAPTAGKKRRSRYSTGGRLELILAEALFASTLQSSESPTPQEVRRGVATTLRQLGVRGCAAQLAAEFGDHPDVAPARMCWALATVRTAIRQTAHTRQVYRGCRCCSTRQVPHQRATAGSTDHGRQAQRWPHGRDLSGAGGPAPRRRAFR